MDAITFTLGSVTKTITLPVGTVAMIEDGFSVQYKWQAEVTDPNDPEATIPNPETKSDLVFRMVRKFITDTTRAANKTAARDTAASVVDAEIDAIDDAGVVTSP